jgi:D-methionine transport system ATP-binding protein
MIEIEGLHKAYRAPDGRRIEVLKGVSLQVPAGSITAVVGPSGAGKSTLAKCISLLERPSSGSIRVNGQDLSRLAGEALRRERRAIGTVFQSSALLQRKTAWQNVALPLTYLGVVPRDIDKRVKSLLAAVGLADKTAFYPAQLSGGQRQRVGIARALALNPSVLLADEATSGLDPDATGAILSLLKQLRDRYGLSIILITHEMDAVRDAALRLQVTYSARQPAATDWISRISRQLDLQIDLLGGHVEVVGGSLAGRLEIAVRFGGGSRSVAELQGELRRLGILAEVLEQPAALQEAV